MAVLR